MWQNREKNQGNHKHKIQDSGYYFWEKNEEVGLGKAT